MNAKRTGNYYDMFAIMLFSEILPKIHTQYPIGPLDGNTRSTTSAH